MLCYIYLEMKNEKKNETTFKKQKDYIGNLT